MRHRTAVLVIGAGVIASATFYGCGDDEGTGGSGGSEPTSTTKAVTTVTKAAVSVTQATTGSGPTVFVGRTCSTDGECGPAGRCILPSADDPVFGGGPANGYCTQACTDASECPNNGLCIEEECLLGCEIGPELEFLDDELSEDKCHGREDVRCVDLTDGPACMPTCGEDSQCPAGRVCDPRISVCVVDPNTGDPNGGACDPEADPPDCAGVCVNFDSGVTMCSNRCVLGGELDGSDCGGIDQGLCVFRPGGYGAGDQGFCSPACSVQTDCNNPTWWCFSNDFAPNGFCFSATACPGGQADCMPEDVCTQTQHGPFCLDPAIPLGEGGAGGGGGGGVGGGGGAGGN